jgi:internalin A
MANRNQESSGNIHIGGDYVVGDKVTGNKISGGNVVGNNNTVIGSVIGGTVIGNKIVNSQNLAQAAQEIKELLDRISTADPTKNPTLVAITAIEAIEKNPTLKDRILNAGKEAGFAAIDAAVDHPAVKIVTAAIKGAIEA